MTILSCRTGLTSLSEDSLALFVVEVSQFQAFRAARSAPQQQWIKTNSFTAKPGRYLCLPDESGQICGAVVITDTAVIWDIAGAATALPKGDWAPDLSFAGQSSLRDLQLGWGLAQYGMPRINKMTENSVCRIWRYQRRKSAQTALLLFWAHISCVRWSIVRQTR